MLRKAELRKAEKQRKEGVFLPYGGKRDQLHGQTFPREGAGTVIDIDTILQQRPVSG